MIREYSRPIVVAIFAIALFVSSLSAEPPKLASGEMDAVAEAYVKLVLAMGQHDADYVDAYYGPAEWKNEAAKENRSLDSIGAETKRSREALQKIPAPADELSRLRREYLTKQLSALEARVRIMKGERLKFDEESRLLYDAVAPTFPESHFQKSWSDSRRRSRVQGRSPNATNSGGNRLWFRKRNSTPSSTRDQGMSKAHARAD